METEGFDFNLNLIISFLIFLFLQFDFPIVNAWEFDESNAGVKNIDLFGASNTEWLTNPVHTSDKEVLISPTVYVGMFKKQLYIQVRNNCL